MKKMSLIILAVSLTVLLFSSCKEDLEIQQSYEFQVEILPVPKRVVMGETVEIRCEIISQGNFSDTKYYVRYFQTDGKGELSLDNGTVLIPNDLYVLKKKTFRMYYQSLSTETQNIDVYFFDSFSNSHTVSFSFNNEKPKDETENADEGISKF